MGAITAVQGTRTSLTATGLSTLASATYCVSDAYSPATNDPLDVVVEVEAATTNTPAGNKQVAVFLKASLDGTNYSSGPESGTTTTDELDLFLLGSVPINSASTTHRKAFSVMAALGYIPHSFKVVPKNDLGVALTSAAIYTAEIAGNAA